MVAAEVPLSPPQPEPGARRVPKRRAQSEVHLHNMMSRVTEQLGEASDSLLPREQAKPGTAARRNVSLHLPRCPPGGDPSASACSASSTATPAGASTPSTMVADSPGKESGVSGSAVYATPGGPGSGPDVAEQIEDLRLQNAVLRKSLAMLQQSVVESMKGNKAQFVGGGHFRRRPVGASNGAGHAASVSMSDSGLGRDSDVDQLRSALAERRQAVREAMAERDKALGEAANARREVAELRSRNEDLRARATDIDALAVQLENSRRNNEALAGRCAVAERTAGESAEAARRAEERREELDAKAAALSEEAAALRTAVAAAEDQAAALSRELAETRAQAERVVESPVAEGCVVVEAAAAARLGDVEAELERLRVDAAAERSRLDRFAGDRRRMAERLLSLMFGSGDGRASLRPCVQAWANLCAAAREERLSARTAELEAEVSRLALDAEKYTTEGARAVALDEELRAKIREADDACLSAKAAGEQLRTMEAQLAKALAEAAESRGQVSEAESKARALEAEVEALRVQCSANGEAATGLQETLEKLRLLEAELDAAKQAGADAERQLADRRSALEAAEERAANSEQRESKLAGDLESASAAATQARDATAAAEKLRDDAQKRIAELEAAAAEHSKGDAQKKAAAKELEAVRADLNDAEKSAREAEAKATEADRRARTQAMRAQSLEERLQAAEARNAEAQRREAEAQSRSKSDDDSRAEAAAKAGQETAGLGEENGALKQEVSALKLTLADAKMSSKSAENKLRALSDEHATLLRALDEARTTRAASAQRMQELEGGSAKFLAEAGKALDDAKQRIRIMVTAPKVCVNVGGDTYDVHSPFPFSAIKDAVSDEVMPKFARVFAVGEEAGDSEIRGRVQEMVEELALNLQSKVHELMPQAEGTCNWDGFGSKCSGLGTK